jgi:hypothetical protein
MSVAFLHFVLILCQIMAWTSEAYPASFHIYSIISSLQSFFWTTNHLIVLTAFTGEKQRLSQILSRILLHRGAGPLSYATCSSERSCIFAATLRGSLCAGSLSSCGFAARLLLWASTLYPALSCPCFHYRGRVCIGCSAFRA